MTRRIGLIGYPLGHSISPIFQQAALDALGIDARYEAWEVPPDQLAAVESRLRAADCLGANVTIPHKSAVRSLLDEIDPAARAIGAVNTITRREDRLLGFNTDAPGFARSLERDAGRGLRDSRLVLLGAGGAARAVVAAALLEGAVQVTVAARRVERARAIIADFQAGPLATTRTRLDPVPLVAADPRLGAAVADCDVLVNATPVGMGSDAATDPPIALDRLARGALVYDLIYRPPLTPLLREARARGAAILNGLPMLVYQGAASFELWTGQPAPVELMRRAAEEALRG